MEFRVSLGRGAGGEQERAGHLSAHTYNKSHQCIIICSCVNINSTFFSENQQKKVLALLSLFG